MVDLIEIEASSNWSSGRSGGPFSGELGYPVSSSVSAFASSYALGTRDFIVPHIRHDGPDVVRSLTSWCRRPVRRPANEGEHASTAPSSADGSGDRLTR